MEREDRESTHDNVRKWILHIIDYKTERFEEVASGMDMVMDIVGLHDYPLRSLDTLRPGGQLLVIPSADLIPDRATLDRHEVTAKWMLVEPDYPALERLATMAAFGELKTIIAGQRPLIEIEDLWRLAEDGAPIGKLAATAG